MTVEPTACDEASEQVRAYIAACAGSEGSIIDISSGMNRRPPGVGNTCRHKPPTPTPQGERDGGESTVDGLTQQDPQDPEQIGPYRILGRLGAGRNGSVYLGRSSDGSLVAVRVLRTGLADDPGFRDRLRRELADSRQAAVKPSTVPVIDADLDADTPWLAAEYVDAPSLADVVAENGPLQVDAARQLARGLAEALVGLHGGGLVHGSLAPSRILITARGPRLIDVELSRAVRAAGDAATEADDIYALGTVLRFAAPATNSWIAELAASCLIEEAAARPTAGELLQRLDVEAAATETSAATAATAVAADQQFSPGFNSSAPVTPPAAEPPTVAIALPQNAAPQQGAFTATTVSLQFGAASSPTPAPAPAPGAQPYPTPFPSPAYPARTGPTRRYVALTAWIAASVLTLVAALTALTLFAASDGAWPDTAPLAASTFEPTPLPPTNPAPTPFPATPTSGPTNLPTSIPTSANVPYTPTVPATPEVEDTSDAYYAVTGDCVYGLNTANSPWSIVSCQSGNFTVKSRFTGTTDTGDCAAIAGGWTEYWTDSDSSQDVLLCLQMNYPSPVAYASDGDCYYMTGSGSSMQFSTVSSCSDGNVQVTGYVNADDDSSYCSGSDGWYSWQPSEYPDLAYTVCFDNI